MKKIDFFLIGVQKSATTWLYHCLHEHPALFVGGKKMEKNYLGGERHKTKGDVWIESLFEKAEKGQKTGSASVDYMYDPDSAKYIRRSNRTPDLILSLRHPVERAVSAFHWVKRRGYLESDSMESAFVRAYADYSKEGPGSTTVYSELIQRSLYYTPLREISRSLPEARILVIFYDEIKDLPADVSAAMYRFLGVDAAYKPISLHRMPKANAGIPVLNTLEKRYPGNVLVQKISRSINELVSILNGKKKRASDQALPIALDGKVLDLFEKDLTELNELLKEGQFQFVKETSPGLISTWKDDLNSIRQP